MITALKAADIIVDTMTNLPGTGITNLSLNKLLYYAQGHSLERNGKPLFKEEIQAWTYGPVIPQVYDEFKKYQKQSIEKPSKPCNTDEIPEEDLEVILDVISQYGKYQPFALVDMTHEKGSPWERNFVEHANAIIPTEEIKVYFKQKEKLEPFKIPDISEEGRHDEKGNLILSEYYEYV